MRKVPEDGGLTQHVLRPSRARLADQDAKSCVVRLMHVVYCCASVTCIT